MAIDDQLAVLLAQNSDLFAAYEEWANGQIMLLAGTVDDPNSFNEVGGKTGALGYYPVVNVSGQTIYVACVARLKAIALGGANAAVLEGLVAQVGGKVASIDDAITELGVETSLKFGEVDDHIAQSDVQISAALASAGAATTLANSKAGLADEKATLAAQKAAAAQTVVDAGGTILAAAQSATTEVAKVTGVVKNVNLGGVHLVPVIKFGRKVWLFSEDGGVSFTALGATGGAAVNAWLSSIRAMPRAINSSPGLVPVVVDGNNKVPIWLDNGGLDVSSISWSMRKKIHLSVQMRGYGAAYSAPISTDGRTLFRLRAKAARRKAGAVVQPTIIAFGDSWMDYVPLPQAMANGVYAVHGGKSADGWITAGEKRFLNGITITDVGVWTRYDASNGAAPPYDCGVDGQSASTVVNGARMIIDGVTCTEFAIYYQDLDGTFQYGVYGASGTVDRWEIVTCAGTGTKKRVVLTGLTDAAHKFEIRTPGNTGVVALHGFIPSRSGVAGGVLHKAGNAGAISDNLNMIVDKYDYWLKEIQPDVIVLALGTNDTSVKNTTIDFNTHVRGMVDAWRAALPDVGIILICPTRVEGLKNSSLKDIRDVLYQIAMEKSCEFYSAFDAFGTSAQMHALGMFDDEVHPGAAGSIFLNDDLTFRMGIR